MSDKSALDKVIEAYEQNCRRTGTPTKFAIEARAALRARLARLEQTQEALIETGFVGALNGGSWTTYLRCRICKGDNFDPKRDDGDYRTVKHEPGCKLAAALLEREP